MEKTEIAAHARAQLDYDLRAPIPSLNGAGNGETGSGAALRQQNGNPGQCVDVTRV